jgi:hypothetical protein
MNVDDYRKSYAAGLVKESGSAPSSGLMPMSTSIPAGAAAANDDPDAIFGEIAIFRDVSRPSETRLAALHNVQTATFLGSKFDRYRPKFLEALRAVAAEPDEGEVRTGALELLALEKDDVARQLLLKGFQDPDKALVPAAKAMQLLSHDDHGVAIPIARKIVAGDYDVAAKGEALRVLASDPDSERLLIDILSDRSQPQQLRSVSASGLRKVNPKQFEKLAQAIVVDEGEDDGVRASALGALNHMLGSSGKADPGFTAAVSTLDMAEKPDALRSATARFLQMQSIK